MKYSSTTGGFYDVDIHGDSIPADAVNVSENDYRALLNGQAAGQGISADGNGYPVLIDRPVVITVPAAIKQRQCRLMLLSAGLLDTVEAAIDAMEGDEGKAAKISWEYASEISRTDPILGQLTAAIGLADSQVDDMFIAASQL